MPEPIVSPEVRIVPTAERYVDSFNRALDIVARERRYIGFLEGPPLESSRDLVQRVLSGEGVQRLAVTPHEEVVGWCDIIRHRMEGFRHAARMGMGVLPAYRGAGLGRRLLSETLDAARALDIERVELEVFASNTAAIALYERLGFVVEGRKSRARKIDGSYDDDLIMARLLDR
ncbi:MAG TPA: GNAT family N-acetyltransferase [Vicinamibacterales bacterium]|nr:GNAT family N-acetyltransferase [Vicinamibacterales bacterium]